MSLTAALKRSRISGSDKTAIAFGDQSWTYAEFDEITDTIAANLVAAGLEPGDRVAFHLLNGPELALGYLGCLKAGCVVVPVNTRLKGPEIDYILRHSGSACYVGQPDLYDEAAKSCPALAAVELRYLLDFPGGGAIRPFDHLLASAGGPTSLPEIAPNQIAAILYTSGTTARPKGVTHSHQSLIQIAHVMRCMQLDQAQVAVVISSMAHLVGFGMLFLSGLINGAAVVITRPFDFDSVLDAYARWRCTYTFGLPVMFHGLLQREIVAPRDVSSGRFYYCGGDSVPPALQEAFAPVQGPTIEAYGATEITPLSWNPPGEVRVGSIGRLGGETAFRLVDSDGHDVKPGEVGEICVEGPHLMLGYWQDRTRQALPCRTAGSIRETWPVATPTAIIGSPGARRRPSSAAEATSPHRRSKPYFAATRPFRKWAWWVAPIPSGVKL
jgi:long-chain acyl-CoA synthetase